MKRKTFITRLALGGVSLTLIPSIGLLQGCKYKPIVRNGLTSADLPLLNLLAETILPSTESSPGAMQAGVGEYILLMYNDCMTAKNQKILLNGLNELDNRSASIFSGSFSEAKPMQRLALLEQVQAEATKYHVNQMGNEEVAPHYFDILKGLTISGYFSSEIGMTEAREYLPVPGKFEACISYKKEDKVWAI